MTVEKLLKRSFALYKSRFSSFNSLETRNKWKQHVFTRFAFPQSFPPKKVLWLFHLKTRLHFLQNQKNKWPFKKLLKRSFRLCKSRVSSFNDLEIRNEWKWYVSIWFPFLIVSLKSGFWLTWTFFNIAAKLKKLESCGTLQIKAENKSFNSFF